MFENIRIIRDALRDNNRFLTLFNFNFNNVRCCVIIELYRQDEYRPEYSLVKMIFWDMDNLERNLKTHINSRDFVDLNTGEFFRFFNIPYNPKGMGNVIYDFKNKLSQEIPNGIEISNELVVLAVRHIDNNRNRNNGCYLTGLMRLGVSQNGTQRHRSRETNEKAQLLRPDVYRLVADDSTITFRFSENPDDERTLDEIMQAFNFG